jgi:hypothetical protein
MATTFILEDETHAAWLGEFTSFAEAMRELKRLAGLPWDQPPNLAPCQSWRTCGRTYVLVEYETSSEPWTELRRMPVLEVDAEGARWDPPFDS